MRPLSFFRRSMFAATAMALFSVTAARGDDRQLLYTTAAAPPNVMIIVSNTESMANCSPGQAQPNGHVCPAAGAVLAFDGMGDGPMGKMGIAKSALRRLMLNRSQFFNFGLTSFSVSRQNLLHNGAVAVPTKRYLFIARRASFCDSGSGGASWACQPAGTALNFGNPLGEPTCSGGPCLGTFTNGGSGAALRSYQAVPIGGRATGAYDPGVPVGAGGDLGNESWIQTIAGDANHQPYLLGLLNSTATRTILVNSTNNGNGAGPTAKQEVLISYVSTSSTTPGASPFRIRQCVSDCVLSSLTFDGEIITVQKDLIDCTSTAPCTASNGSVRATVSVDYVVPPPPSSAAGNAGVANLVTYCSESDSKCSYPMIYGYGSQLREEMGWINYDETNTSQSSAGWINQSNNNPQPIVMIAHPYAPWTAYNGLTPSGPPPNPVQYTQSSSPCILRSLRPSAALLDNGTGVEADHFPIFDAASDPTCATGNCANSCDKTVDGLYQTGNFVNPAIDSPSGEIIPIIFPRKASGSQAPITKLLTDTQKYFIGGSTSCSFNPASCPVPAAGIDGFCAVGGQPSRCDDPYTNCRSNAIILITDSYNTSSPNFSFGAGNDITTSLSAYHLPVFVIGFAVQDNGTGACTLKSGLPGNSGQCIADFTGATTYQGITPRQGYYTAQDSDHLVAALDAALDSILEVTRNFATATIPSVQTSSAGVAYLSVFNPQNNRSIWSGHLRAFSLSATTGLIQTVSGGTPDPKSFVFGTGTVAPAGSLIWDAGSTGDDTSGTLGNLDGSRNVNVNLLLTDAPGAGNGWSDANDRANVTVGRNVFFGIPAGSAGCTTPLARFECLVQIPVGGVGAHSAPGATEPPGGWGAPPAPDTTPAWWSNVLGSSLYVNVPASVNATGSEAGGNRNQAMQNAFSFVRGNRDPVVEDIRASSKFLTASTTCLSLATDAKSPCYSGDILGDIFHSNPVIVGPPSDDGYRFAQDPGTSLTGAYGDRGDSYNTFRDNYLHRRKILYVGADDALFHAFDAGVYNGDQTSYKSGSVTISPYLNAYSLGSGREIFAYAPRSAMNKIFELAHTPYHDWTVDGAPTSADVYIDVQRTGLAPQGVATSGSTANITGTSPKWRTVIIGAEREGGMPPALANPAPNPPTIQPNTSGSGGSVFALDVTDPDQSAHMASGDAGNHKGVPECLVSNFDSASTGSTPCAAPYPRILWEIRDDQQTSTAAPVPAENSGSGETAMQDLGMTWSRPAIGRVRVNNLSAGVKRDFFVAIFGGGYNHSGTTYANVTSGGNSGNSLYMVDIETGKFIYKRNVGTWSTGADNAATGTRGLLPAAVPGEASLVDYNGDGFVDWIYFGDTQGRIWKVDLTSTADFCSATGTNCPAANNRIAPAQWSPALVFDPYTGTTLPTGSACSALLGTTNNGCVRQPIFTRPTPFSTGNDASGRPIVAIAVGTGDRDNMPSSTDTQQNVFLIVRDTGTTLHLSDLTKASLTTNACTTSTACLGGNGMYVVLTAGLGGAEIVNTNSLIFEKKILFNTFRRTTIAGICNQVGQAYIYDIDASTGVSNLKDSSGNLIANKAISGAQVASDPTGYLGPDGTANGINTTDKLLIDNTDVGNLPTARIKTWKEQ
jgi:Tfp pilus tip-associated adhesin PilY1